MIEQIGERHRGAAIAGGKIIEMAIPRVFY